MWPMDEKSTRVRAREGLRTCPRCRAQIDPLPIVYGYPTRETWLEAQSGRIRLGGCVIGDESPDYVCPACDALLPWVNPDRPLRARVA